LNNPQGLTVDISDTVYIADTDNGRIRMCPPADPCSDFTTGTPQFQDLSVDTSGNIYGVGPNWDLNYNSTVVKYGSNGVLLGIYLGEPNVPYLTDGHQYNRPKVSLDADQNILITEENGHRLIKLDPTGTTEQWSFGVAGVPNGDNDHLASPMITAADSYGNIYVPNRWSCDVTIIHPNGVFSDTLGTCGDGSYQFNGPTAVAIDQNDHIYVVDNGNNRVMIYNETRDYIGQIGETGVCAAAYDHLCYPEAVAIDSAGNIYVADSGNLRVQKFNSNLEWQMTIGNGVYGNQFDQFAWPNAIAVDDQGKIYVSEWGGQRVQVFDSNGEYLTTIGGVWGTNSAQFNGISSIAVDNQGNLYVSDVGHRIQKYAPGVPNWKQVNINGFGNRNIEVIPSMAVFNDYLYAGTFNFTDNIHEIYRSMDGRNWEETSQNFGDGVSGLIAFNEQLFAGTWDGSIWSSLDGLTWTEAITVGMGIASFSQFNNMLYAGTYGHNCGEEGMTIWQSSDGENWTPFGPDDDPYACAIISSAVFNGNLYWGVADWTQTVGGRIWRTDGTTITEVVGDGFGDSDNMDPGGLAVLGNAIYASIDIPNGYQIWRSESGDSGSWSKVFEMTKDGIGTLDGLIVLDDHLFFTAQNEPYGMQVWMTADGDTWQQIGYEGFGDSNNSSSEWSNSLSVFNGRFYIGVRNTANASEIWSYEPEIAADFSADPSVGIAPLEVTFTNTSSGTLTASLWDFGDGFTSTDTNPVHTYNNAGASTVTLTASSFGNPDTVIKTNFITVYAPVSADFSADPTSGPVPLTVAFTNLATGDFDTCLWDFGDTSTSTLCSPPDHVYQSPGVYTVKLTASGLGGSDAETKVGYITVENQMSFLPVITR
jgi:PKD repeat protein/sugar lactone lactonase YvrE